MNTGGSQRADAGTDPQSPYCQVRAMVVNRCLSCHSNPPTAGAPMPLVTYVDLLEPAPTAPSLMVAEVALDRIQNAARPMPPAPLARVSGAEIQGLRAWLDEGTPQRSCGPVTPPPMMDAGGTIDAGRAMDAGREAAVVQVRDAGREVSVPDAGAGTTDPFAVASVCTSGVRWTGGNNFNMRPGEPCFICHGNYAIPGTVYPTGHEPNDCNGVNGTATGAQVVITDANGTVRNLAVNGVGNFETTTSIATPFRAKVVYQGRERVMNTPQTSGNCNSCHTQNGNGSAPGRIVLP
jgi:hypothetical protein